MHHHTCIPSTHTLPLYQFTPDRSTVEPLVMITSGPEGVWYTEKYTESSSFPMDDDDAYYIMRFIAYNDIHGHFYKLFGVWLTEMFVIVVSVILKRHCTWSKFFSFSTRK